MPDVLRFYDEPPMTSDEEQWTEAPAILRQFHGRALAITDDRIADVVGDIAGQTRWRSIRSRIFQMMKEEPARL